MKNKFAALTIIVIMITNYCDNSYAQDLIDPYKNYTGQNINDISYPSPLVGYYAPNPNGFLFRPNSRDYRSCS
ncbi:MAG: hypothetical protein M3Q95_03020, partial [Bacteroidota bacterium]|nr:hypothetical protein [Bacteroidota bacterium]